MIVMHIVCAKRDMRFAQIILLMHTCPTPLHLVFCDIMYKVDNHNCHIFSGRMPASLNMYYRKSALILSREAPKELVLSMVTARGSR